MPDSLAEVSGWFPDGKGRRRAAGSELPIRMLREAVRRLRPGAGSFYPPGASRMRLPFRGGRAAVHQGGRSCREDDPAALLLADSETLKNLIADGIVHLVPKGSRFLWETRVWRLSGLTSGETS